MLVDLLSAVPLPVWAIAAAAAIPAGVITWLSTASVRAPMDTDLWDGGAHSTPRHTKPYGDQS